MKNLPWILVGMLTLALVLTWCSGGGGNTGYDGGGDTIWLPGRVDTIRDTVVSPPVSEKPAGTESARLPVQKPEQQKPEIPNPSSEPDGKPEHADSLPANISTDTLALEDVMTPDSVDVLIPIVEREYRSPDYRIVVSGYNPQLRSVELYSRTQMGIVNPPAQKQKRWGLGPCISVGIGPDGKPQYLLGASVHYSLLQW